MDEFVQKDASVLHTGCMPELGEAYLLCCLIVYTVQPVKKEIVAIVAPTRNVGFMAASRNPTRPPQSVP
jgi:hypothetical protein